uniref:Uncharacterized protein n=1 Tax=Anguilla anguilla TaxID=7936 RepID=A0A0E9WU14_ANGAN
MRGINCKALWIKALYKCSPFTIYPPECPKAGSLTQCPSGLSLPLSLLLSGQRFP